MRERRPFEKSLRRINARLHGLALHGTGAPPGRFEKKKKLLLQGERGQGATEITPTDYRLPAQAKDRSQGLKTRQYPPNRHRGRVHLRHCGFRTRHLAQARTESAGPPRHTWLHCARGVPQNEWIHDKG